MRPRPEEAGGSDILRSGSERERRREARDRAERLDSRRGQFTRWMRNQGMSEEQRDQALRDLDHVVDNLRQEGDR